MRFQRAADRGPRLRNRPPSDRRKNLATKHGEMPGTCADETHTGCCSLGVLRARAHPFRATRHETDACGRPGHLGCRNLCASASLDAHRGNAHKLRHPRRPGPEYRPDAFKLHFTKSCQNLSGGAFIQGLGRAHKLRILFCVFREPRTADRAPENGPRQSGAKTSQLSTARCRVRVPIKRTQAAAF